MMSRLLMVSALMAAGCSGPAANQVTAVRPAPTPEEKLAAARREARSWLPKDRSTVAILAEAGPYFDEPAFIWMEAETLATALNKRGIKSDAGEILRGSVDVMKRLRAAPIGDENFRRFAGAYRMTREDTSGRGRPRTHAEAVEAIVKQSKFQFSL